MLLQAPPADVVLTSLTAATGVAALAFGLARLAPRARHPPGTGPGHAPGGCSSSTPAPSRTPWAWPWRCCGAGLHLLRLRLAPTQVDQGQGQGQGRGQEGGGADPSRNSSTTGTSTSGRWIGSSRVRAPAPAPAVGHRWPTRGRRCAPPRRRSGAGRTRPAPGQPVQVDVPERPGEEVQVEPVAALGVAAVRRRGELAWRWRRRSRGRAGASTPRSRPASPAPAGRTRPAPSGRR